MVKERLKSPRLRLFVALDLPDRVREGIAAWGRRELVDPALRPLRPESLHITLAFLGYRPQRDAVRMAATLREVGGAATPVELLDPVPRPPRTPRLFALPALAPGAEALQAELVRALVAAGLYKPEKRPFWPHVAVARVRARERGSRRPARVERPPGPLPASLSETFRGVRMTLYRSELQPQGARYVPMAQVELSAGGRQ